MPPILSSLNTSRCSRRLDRRCRSAGAPQIWPEARDNIAFQFNRGEIAPVEAAIRAAAHVVECELVNNRVAAARWKHAVHSAVRRRERPSAPDRVGRGAHMIRDLLADSSFVSPVASFASAFPTSAADSG